MFKDGLLKAIFETGTDVVTGIVTADGTVSWFKAFRRELVICTKSSINVYSCLAGVPFLVINPKEITKGTCTYIQVYLSEHDL